MLLKENKRGPARSVVKSGKYNSTGVQPIHSSSSIIEEVKKAAIQDSETTGIHQAVLDPFVTETFMDLSEGRPTLLNFWGVIRDRGNNSILKDKFLRVPSGRYGISRSL